MNALISGEVDYYENPPADLVPLLEAADGVVVEVLDPLGNQGMLRMNHLQPPFDNQLIRQAVLKAMNQEQYMQAAVGNPSIYSVCMSYYACGSPLETDAGVEGMTYDPDAARALLEEAGYDGTPVVILQPADIPVTNAASLVTAQALREVGMTVELVAMDWASVTSRRAGEGSSVGGRLEHLPHLVDRRRHLQSGGAHGHRRRRRPRLVRLAGRSGDRGHAPRLRPGDQPGAAA